MRPQGCQETDRRRVIRCKLQISKVFLPLCRLTLAKSGTYTDRVTHPLLRGGVATVCVLLLALVVTGPGATVRAQARQRSMYVSIVDSTGNPVPNLGPADFVIREDKVA